MGSKVEGSQRGRPSWDAQLGRPAADGFAGGGSRQSPTLSELHGQPEGTEALRSFLQKSNF